MREKERENIKKKKGRKRIKVAEKGIKIKQRNQIEEEAEKKKGGKK